MKILVRNTDKLVLYADDSMYLSDTEAGGAGWCDPSFNHFNAELHNSGLPPAWSGGVWTYELGVWSVADADANSALLDKLRASIWERVKAHREKLTQTGGYTTGGKWYHSDTFSRSQQIGLVMMGASIPPVQWKTMDGTFVTMTQALANAIFMAAASQDQAHFAYAEVLKAAIYLSTDPESIDILAGWPSTYTG